MAVIIDELRADHQRYRVHLDLFQREVEKFGAGLKANYSLLRRVSEFFSLFPDQRHHRIEDLIYDRLAGRTAEAASIPDISKEHAQVFENATIFRDAIAQVFLDQELPRQEFAQLALDFITRFRRHMEMEESSLFPTAEGLGEDDWAAVRTAIAKISAEPLEPVRQMRLEEIEQEIRELLEEAQS